MVEKTENFNKEKHQQEEYGQPKEGENQIFFWPKMFDAILDAPQAEAKETSHVP